MCLLIFSFIFIGIQSFAQDSEVKEIDDRPEVLKSFEGSEEEYQKIKKVYYEENNLFEESDDSWTTVSKDEKIECDINFSIPENANQSDDIIGTWQIVAAYRNGEKDFDKELGDPTLVYDFNLDNRLILTRNEGKFSHFLTDKSYWLVNGTSLTIASFNQEACLVETMDFSIVKISGEELELNVNDPDGQINVNYDIKLKLIEK